ncbi:MAG: LysR family transcriptional regulator [Clostridia bacterium]|nr:LysR family transcriptional regulator [Clostridia bacterium]
MTIRHLEIFVQVYREKSITRAAEKLYMTQPAVSVAIRELEKQYDVALFERLGRRLYVTGAGEALYARAVQMLEEFHGLEQGLERKTALRVGSSVTLGNFLLPRVAAEWQMRHPESPLQVTVANGERLQQMLRDNLLDVAVIEGAVNREELETRAFRQDRLVLVLPQEHPLAVLELITLAQVLEYPLLVREEGSAGRRCLEQVLARRGLQAERRWESIDTQALLRAVAQGLGVAFLPRELAEGVPGMVIRTLADEDFCRENVLVWHRHKRLSAELLELMELLEK